MIYEYGPKWEQYVHLTFGKWGLMRVLKSVVPDRTEQYLQAYQGQHLLLLGPFCLKEVLFLNKISSLGRKFAKDNMAPSAIVGSVTT